MEALDGNPHWEPLRTQTRLYFGLANLERSIEAGLG